MQNPAVIIVLDMLITVYGNDTDVYSGNMFDHNIVKIKLEGNADVSTATVLKNQKYSEMAVGSEEILDIKKESEEHCELEVKTEPSSDIEEECPKHLEMKFEIDQGYTDMLNDQLLGLSVPKNTPTPPEKQQCNLGNTNQLHENPETSHNFARAQAEELPISSAGVNTSVIRGRVKKEERCQCPECGKELGSKSSLRRHLVRRHSAETAHVCSVCSLKCVCRSQLVIHMRMHSGERPFKCSVCSEMFARNDPHKRHMRKHTGEKPHTCEFCNSSFSRLDHLKSHNKIHYRPAAT